MTFEEMYNNCWVEFRDSEPYMAYINKLDAKDGIFWDRYGDTDRLERHSYEIKYLKDGKYYESEEEAE